MERINTIKRNTVNSSVFKVLRSLSYYLNLIIDKCVCVCVCVCGYAIDISSAFLRGYPWLNMCITNIGGNKMLMCKIVSVLNK